MDLLVKGRKEMGLWFEGVIKRRPAPEGVKWNLSAFEHQDEREWLMRNPIEADGSCCSGEGTIDKRPDSPSSRRPGGSAAVIGQGLLS